MLIDEILDGRADAIVANPPYIFDPDEARRAATRARYVSAHGKYGLGAPFTERMFQLVREGGRIAQITSNAFMKREYGAPLVEQVLPRYDLTHVIDTSGAFIPGHGTPTVILVARSRAPRDAGFRTIVPKRGEPKKPDEGDPGLVWRGVLKTLGYTEWDRCARPYGIEGTRVVSDALARRRVRVLGDRLGPVLLGAAIVLALRARRLIHGRTLLGGLNEIDALTGLWLGDPIDATDDECALVMSELEAVTPPMGPLGGGLHGLCAPAMTRSWGTRDTDWIGDLYQATHGGTVKRDALCQTPWFVRDLLLDLALTPTLDEIAPRDTEGHRAAFDRVRLLDPACGTGHLLVGAFEWIYRDAADSMEYTADGAASLALSCVEGVELTPMTAELARLRLALAWWDATGHGLARLRRDEAVVDRYTLDAVDRVRVATGNSLLEGCAGRQWPQPVEQPVEQSRITEQLALWTEAAE